MHSSVILIKKKKETYWLYRHVHVHVYAHTQAYTVNVFRHGSVEACTTLSSPTRCSSDALRIQHCRIDREIGRFDTSACLVVSRLYEPRGRLRDKRYLLLCSHLRELQLTVRNCRKEGCYKRPMRPLSLVRKLGQCHRRGIDICSHLTGFVRW